jgi:hypothetical protein
MPTPDDAPALTLVMPLRKKDSISTEDFYEYWFNAHVTLPPRFPGLESVWLHAVSFPHQIWPRVPDVSTAPDPQDEFEGVPEATFRTMDDLQAFQGASGVQMDDGINFLSEMLAYANIGANSLTLVESIDPAPDGHDTYVRHLVFLRRRPGVPVEDFRDFVAGTLAPAYAGEPEVLKLRRHLFEPVEVTLDHPGVRMSKPLERQYQAALEVVVEDEDALQRFAQSPGWAKTAPEISRYCEAVHAARVERCVTTKINGTPTLAGIRGVAVADVITRLGADSQKSPEVSSLFLPVG